jgi:hypothetical protein
VVSLVSSGSFIYDDAPPLPETISKAEKWEKDLAKAYYDRLFKEYALCDLSRYKEGKVRLVSIGMHFHFRDPS